MSDEIVKKAQKLAERLFGNVWRDNDFVAIIDALRAYGDQREREALEKAAEIARFWADPSVPERIETLISKATP